jgi:hypothetical protein
LIVDLVSSLWKRIITVHWIINITHALSGYPGLYPVMASPMRNTISHMVSSISLINGQKICPDHFLDIGIVATHVWNVIQELNLTNVHGTIRCSVAINAVPPGTQITQTKYNKLKKH